MAVGLTPPDSLLPVAGIKLGVVAAGLRYRQRADLVLMTLSPGSHTATVFTRNRFAAAPVIVARNHHQQASTRALLINAGQANAGTGEMGIEVAEQSCDLVAKLLEVPPEAVLPFSTGVIGAYPSVDKIQDALPGCIELAAEDCWLEASQGIMTTDTVAKGVSVTVNVDGADVTITGIAKGSGMIRPNMATMLAFVGTDASVDQQLLQDSLAMAVDASFNRITVDGDTSTNDACVLAATGKSQAPAITQKDSNAWRIWYDGLKQILLKLAHAIVRDGEGATKFVSIVVEQGASESDCLEIAYTVAHSPLVKTALFASDANWGRILAAVGRAPVDDLDVDDVSIYINSTCVLDQGNIAADYTDERGQQAIAPEEIELRIVLHAGEASATIWTTDLSHEYIRINAEYRT
jgi:glutamate N-acetyltransferase/amino-acid N-acetyltransferase